jgi:ribosome-associated translation inhibitor RaiA
MLLDCSTDDMNDDMKSAYKLVLKKLNKQLKLDKKKRYEKGRT